MNNRKIFVFGSNLAGRHGAGSAKEAMKRHGAIYGVPWGLQGNSYAIPTKDENLHVLPLEQIGSHVAVFTLFASKCPHFTFEVVAIGCGLAGYQPAQIAPFFGIAQYLPNVKLPPEFIRELQK